MVSSVAQYLVDGCMRCKLGATPACKVHRWIAEIETLRHIVLECGLNEEVKWGVPCYTLSGKNVVMVSAFKEYACLSFFKGSLLKDPAKILVKQGEYGQEGRILKFTEQAQILSDDCRDRSRTASSNPDRRRFVLRFGEQRFRTGHEQT